MVSIWFLKKKNFLKNSCVFFPLTPSSYVLRTQNLLKFVVFFFILFSSIFMLQPFHRRFISVLPQFEIWGKFPDDRLVSSQIQLYLFKMDQPSWIKFELLEKPSSQGLQIIIWDFEEYFCFLKSIFIQPHPHLGFSCRPPIYNVTNAIIWRLNGDEIYHLPFRTKKKGISCLSVWPFRLAVDYLVRQ